MTGDEAQAWYAGQVAAAQDPSALHWVVEAGGGLAGVVFLHSVSDVDRKARLAVGLFAPASGAVAWGGRPSGSCWLTRSA